MDLAGGRSPATDCSRRVSGGKLPRIPLIDVTDAGPVALITAARERCERLLEAGRRCYGPAFITIGDPLSRRWLARSRNPYLDEIDSIAAALDRPGAYVLNLSYEWSCTSAIAADSEFGGSRLQRTVDWPLAGLGRNLIVARQAGARGTYYNVTWPGFVGVASDLAPGRFAAALNQAPMRRFGLPLVFDWVLNRVAMWPP